MSLAVVIPVNRLERAKGRLDGLLDATERRRLALATLGSVTAAVRAAGLEPLILTADADVAAAMTPRTRVVPEDENVAGLNAQLTQAIAGLPETLILHADLPLASARALHTLAGAADVPPSVTIVRSSDGGTNAMFLRPATCIPLSYGRNSCRLHTEAAAAAGITARIVSAPDLELDLDTPADLAAFFEVPGWRNTPAGQLLDAWRVPARVAAITPGDRRR